MNNKKIILPTNNEIEKYNNKKIKILSPDPFKDLILKDNKNQKKHKFCSTIKINYNWKDLVIDVLNNTDYNND